MESFKLRQTRLTPMQGLKGRSLNYQEVYPCPVCRHGQIEALTLMDAFACNFCHHIFTANLETPSVQVVDSSQPMVWRWTGQGWKSLRSVETEMTWLVWILGMSLALLPALLVSACAYVFPPLEGGRNDLPWLWALLTLAIHLGLVAWLLAEHYQFAFYVGLKVRWQQVRRYLSSWGES